MSKSLLLKSSHGFQSLNRINRIPPLLSKPQHYLLTSHSLPNFAPISTAHRFRPVRALNSSPSPTEEAPPPEKSDVDATTAEAAARKIVEYPSGEFEMEEFGPWRQFLVKTRMLFAWPWERVKKGSVLSLKLRGEISDQLKRRFTSGLSLPQICENFTKAAYDPRISGIYLHIEPLSCGWGKVDEIRRHIINFKKSGKFVVCYVPICGEKEYYLASACEEVYAPPSAYVALYGLTVQSAFLGGVLEKIGVEPQIQRIGKYKSAGDQLSRKNMSKENCEMLTALLDNVYGNWLDTVSSTQGKRREEIEEFLNSGVYQVEKLKEEGWLTNVLYDDEVISMLKERLGQKEKLLTVDYRMWREIRLLSESKPVIASMSDVAASGGYYMAMAAEAIVAEKLTLTGSIGVVTGKFSLDKLYERIGYNKEIISRGKYAELIAAEQRPFRPEEAELFAKSAQNAYKSFRDKAASSRSMTIDQMEEVAQGRVWSGKDALSNGLVDAIGGFARAVAIAKHKANIPQDQPVRLIEVSKPSLSVPELLSGIGSSALGLEETTKDMLRSLTSSGGIQARMEDILFEREGASEINLIVALIKDFLSSL